MSESNLSKFKGLLAELFMFEQADLDFGIYRIMNAKRDEITRFLDNDLLPQVRESLAELASGDRAQLENELAKAIESLRELGSDPESSSKVKELREQLAAHTDIDAIESEIFSHLYEFFRRYYSEGDFLSLRRYKAGVYAIPYEGEEVKLHWANADQYYIKTSENFRDYTFMLTDGRRVHFKLLDAETEPNNNKTKDGQERRFILAEEPVAEENGELIIRFDFRGDGEKRTQSELNKNATEEIFKSENYLGWLTALAAKLPTEKNPERTLLEKQLNEYTARNTFDYFIHKDLGRFLKRELDFYIKNEVMFLDDIESDDAPRVERYLAKIKAMRGIAQKVIDFLSQLEDFEKKLWLKKKFVINTNYCVTLDLISEEFYSEIAGNDSQREEWVRLFSIDAITKDLSRPGYSSPLTVEFLRANPFLVLDTIFFNESFKRRLVASFEDLDNETHGLIIHSENFQALSFLQNRYMNRVHSVYIDPPYNTDASPIMYKNGYRRSSWVCMVTDRLKLDLMVRKKPSIRCIAIDDFEYPDLQELLEQSGEMHHATAVVRSKPQGRPTATGFSANHEYAVFWGSSDAVIGRLPRTGSKADRYPYSDEKGIYAWSNFRKSGTDSDRSDRRKSYYPVYVAGDEVRIPKMTWNDVDESWIIEDEASSDEIVVWPLDSDKNEKVWTCSPTRAVSEIEDIRVQRDAEGRIELQKKYRPNQEGALPGTWWDDSKYSSSESGTKVLKDLFGSSDFDYPKSVNLVTDSIRVCGASRNDTVLDYFAGSGTTAHSIINLNREDGQKRKYILVEMGDYFDTVLKPRIQKVIYSRDWREGRPVSRQGSSHLFKYIRLESYEDSLNNLHVTLTADQSSLLKASEDFREDYVLRYMLDVETRGSASVLNIGSFVNPFNYQLRIATGSVAESRYVSVDLVETFNYLLGLEVKHKDFINDFQIVEGINLSGEKVLVIWRNTQEKSNADLDQFFQKQAYKTGDTEFDLIYVNGDNNLENLRRTDETWKVRLIEQEFHRLMFDVRDI